MVLKITAELQMTDDLWPQTSQKQTEGVHASNKTALRGTEKDNLSSQASASKAQIATLAKEGGALEDFVMRINHKHAIYSLLSKLCDCALHLYLLPSSSRGQDQMIKLLSLSHS